MIVNRRDIVFIPPDLYRCGIVTPIGRIGSTAGYLGSRMYHHDAEIALMMEEEEGRTEAGMFWREPRIPEVVRGLLVLLLGALE